MHPRHAIWTLALGTALFVLAPRAIAQLPPPKADVSRAVSLEWNAPAECPARSYVLSELARQLEGATLTPEKRITARADVRRGEGQRWHLRLVTESGEQRGDRTLEAESCRAAADATALIVAMAVDPSRTLGDAGAPPPALTLPPVPVAPTATPVTTAAAATAPSAAPTASAPPPIPPPAPPPPGTAPPPRSRPATSGPSPLAHFGISGSVFGDDGVLSGVSPGVGGAVAWLPGRVRFEVSAAYFPPERVQVASNPARGATLDLATVGLRGCYALLLGRLELGPCAGGEVGFLRGAGFGVVTASEGGTPWEALMVGALGSLRIGGPFSFRLSLDALAPLVRPTFVLAAPPRGAPLNVHKAAPVAGRLSFGGELRF